MFYDTEHSNIRFWDLTFITRCSGSDRGWFSRCAWGQSFIIERCHFRMQKSKWGWLILFHVNWKSRLKSNSYNTFPLNLQVCSIKQCYNFSQLKKMYSNRRFAFNTSEEPPVHFIKRQKRLNCSDRRCNCNIITKSLLSRSRRGLYLIRICRRVGRLAKLKIATRKTGCKDSTYSVARHDPFRHYMAHLLSIENVISRLATDSPVKTRQRHRIPLFIYLNFVDLGEAFRSC